MSNFDTLDFVYSCYIFKKFEWLNEWNPSYCSKVNNVTVIIPAWERENPFSPAEWCWAYQPLHNRLRSSWPTYNRLHCSWCAFIWLNLVFYFFGNVWFYFVSWFCGLVVLLFFFSLLFWKHLKLYGYVGGEYLEGHGKWKEYDWNIFKLKSCLLLKLLLKSLLKKIIKKKLDTIELKRLFIG